MVISIQSVQTKSDLSLFIDLPWKLYADYPRWMPPLKFELTKRLDVRKNSFFKKGRGQLFLAKKGDEVVGRISASIDPVNMKKSENREGNFGCYESIKDMDVAQALVGAGLNWLKENNVSKVIGPIHFRLEDPYPGFLVDGHQCYPYFMMAYSMPYYPKQMDELGFEKVMDLYSYEVDKDCPLPKELSEKAEEASKIEGLRLRNINMKNLYADAEIIGDIFNEALSSNWGHVPFTKGYVRKMAKDLKMLADPRIIFIAEVKGRPVGAVINLPNYNDLLGDLNGSIFPRGIMRILFQKKRIKSLRGYAMAVRNEFQGSGLGCLLTKESFIAGRAAGYERGEVTWVLGNNSSMNKLAEFMGGNCNKTYRLYQMDL